MAAPYCGTSRTTGPLAAGGGAADGAAGSTFGADFGGGFPIGPYMNAIASTAAATIVPNMPAIFCEFIAISRRSPQCPIAENQGYGEWGSAELNRPVLGCEHKIGENNEWLMPPAVNAAVFLLLGLAAIWGIRKNLMTGTASSRGWTCTSTITRSASA